MQSPNTIDMSTDNSESIAIIGMSCRLPGGASSPLEFFEFLMQGGDGIVDVPEDRWDNQAYYDKDRERKNRLYINQGGFIKNIDQFDPQFFGISPKEAPAIDPQHRWLLELVYESFENAGLKTADLRGSNTAVYIGQFMHDYEQLQMDAMAHDLIDSHSATGQSMTLTANRISYVFDLTGPSVSLDTACSSSLVALDMACQAILRGDSDLAIAGGVNILLRPEATMAICKASMLSPDCRCKSFDASANGYVRSEGAAIVLIKRLADAIRDKDPVLAVIRATGVNQDGQTNGITVPNGESQKKLLYKSLQRAGLKPEDIDYLEAHGTGTAVGDPIEINAMGSVLKMRYQNGPSCVFGSVKSNIGHTEAVAGVAGLIKTVLAINAGVIPKNINFNEINPAIDLQALNLNLALQNTPWPDNKTRPKRAVVNSFGFGGTNSNAIIQEYPEKNALGKKLQKINTKKIQLPEIYWLPLSAKSEKSLVSLASEYLRFLDQNTEYLSLDDICYTAAERRDHYQYRVAFSGKDKNELADAIRSYVNQQIHIGWISGYVQSSMGSDLAFVFSGMGTQWVGMGRDLYESNQIFKSAIDKCDKALKPLTGWSLVDKLYIHPETELNNRTDISQPAIFAVQVALFELLSSWNIHPKMIVGHSAGEVAAAYLAGVYTFDDAIKIIYQRSRLQYTTEGSGKMMAVGLTEKELQPYIGNYLESISIAAINNEDAITLAGGEEILQAIYQRLDANGHFAKFLNVNVPYHSPVMDSIKQPLIDSLADIKVKKPAIQLYSTVSGELTNDNDWGPAYWADNVRKPVLFQAAIENMIGDGATSFIEISANPALASSIEKIVKRKKIDGAIAICLKRENNCAVYIRRLISQLYVNGVEIPWARLYPQGEHVLLPNYQWNRSSYWLEDERVKYVRINNPVPGAGMSKEDHVFLGRRVSSHLGLWQKNILLNEIPLLADHQVEGEVVYPAAAYIDTALALANNINQGNTSINLENIIFHKALFLNHEQATQLETNVDLATGRYEIGAVNSQDGNWHTFNEGRINKILIDNTITLEPALDVHSMSKKFSNHAFTDEFYQHCTTIGLHYLPRFQAIREVWYDTEEAFSEWSLPLELRDKHNEHKLHPVILDASFQNLFATINYGALPVSIGQIRYYQQPQYEGYSYLITHFKNSEMIIGDIVITDKQGNLLVEISNILCKPTNTNLKSIDNLLYELQWQEKDIASSKNEELKIAGDKWLIFKNASVNCEHFLELGNQSDYLVIDPQFIKDEDLIGLLSQEAKELSGIIYFAPANETLSNIDNDILQNTLALLKIIQAMVTIDWKPSFAFYLITQGAQAISGSTDVVNLPQAHYWGFSRVLASEHNELFVGIVDLDASTPDINAKMLLDEISSTYREREVAFRSGVRYVHKLEHLTQYSLSAHTKDPIKLGENDNYIYREDDRFLQKYLLEDPILEGHVKVNVKTIIPGNLRWRISDIYVCAGDVSFSRSANYDVGDRIVFVSDVLASSTIINTQSAAIIPSSFSFADACISAMQALGQYASLDVIGDAKAISSLLLMGGGSVLSESLLNFSEENSWDVSLCSADQYTLIDNISGFNKVSKQWPDNLISSSLKDLLICTDYFDLRAVSCLKPFSHFIDWRDQLVDAQTLKILAKNNIHYYSMNIKKILAHQPKKIGKWLASIMKDVTPVQDIGFEKIGIKNWVALDNKENLLLVDLQQDLPEYVIPANPVHKINEQKSYLITGGLSGLGLIMMDWLVQKGARYIVLTARRLPDSTTAQKIESIRSRGVYVLIVQADISDFKQAENLFNTIDREMPPLAGILHSAGVLDDGMIRQQSPEKFEKVFAPKISGAYNLHRLTQSLSLDWFVCFSSVAAVLGWAGQVNYAAANSFMDALCIYRRQLGLPGLSINWGPWAEAGMAARLDTHDIERMENSGMYPLAPDAGTAVLDKILQYPVSQVGVFDIHWNKFIERYSRHAAVGLLEKFSDSTDTPQSEAIRNQLLHLPGFERETLLQEKIHQLLAEVIGFSGNDQIHPKVNVFEYGLNSLMAMDFKNRLQMELAMSLPAALVLKYPTIEAMTAHILTLLDSEDAIIGNTKREENYTGPVNLTLQQIRILESGLMPDRFVIPYHKVIKNLDKKILESALISITNYHDALRLTFSVSDQKWSAKVNPLIDSVSVVEITPENFDTHNIESWLDEYMFKLMLDFNINTGPLIKVYIFSNQDKSESVVSVLIHHLTNDIISTNQIIEDLLKTYTQMVKGNLHSLPVKQISYKEVIDKLYEYAKSLVIIKEKDYWLSLPWAQIKSLPVDSYGDNNYGSTYRVALSLTETETETLNKVLGMQLKVPLYHALVSAMSFALTTYQNSNTVYFSSINGRTLLNQIVDDLDSSRITGWFSTESHMVLQSSQEYTSIERLMAIKNQIETMPNSGIGLQLLMSLSEDKDITTDILPYMNRDLVFNYLGTIESSLIAERLNKREILGEKCEHDERNLAQREMKLLFLFVTLNGKLGLDLQYSKNLHQHESIITIARNTMQELLRIITDSQKLLLSVDYKLENAGEVN